MKPKAIAGVFLVLAALATVTQADCDLRSRGFAGFAYRDLSEADLDSLGRADLKGFAVTMVVPDSPAEGAGLAAGDIVVAIDGEPVEDTSGLLDRLRSYYAGDRAAFSVLRSGEALELTLAFAANRETSTQVEVEYTCFESEARDSGR